MKQLLGIAFFAVLVLFQASSALAGLTEWNDNFSTDTTGNYDVSVFECRGGDGRASVTVRASPTMRLINGQS